MALKKSILFCYCTILAGCLHRGERIQKEQGVVINKKEVAGYYHTYTTYDRVYYGRSYKGSRQYISVPRQYTQYVPPVYTITFKCQHQKTFGINREDVYKNLNAFDTVTIEYYDLLNGDNEVKDYDFLTAYKQHR